VELPDPHELASPVDNSEDGTALDAAVLIWTERTEPTAEGAERVSVVLNVGHGDHRTGTKLVRVTPSNRKSNSSIAAAVAIALKGGIDGALAAARENAVSYANATGLTLGRGHGRR